MLKIIIISILFAFSAGCSHQGMTASTDYVSVGYLYDAIEEGTQTILSSEDRSSLPILHVIGTVQDFNEETYEFTLQSDDQSVLCGYDELSDFRQTTDFASISDNLHNDSYVHVTGLLFADASSYIFKIVTIDEID